MSRTEMSLARRTLIGVIVLALVAAGVIVLIVARTTKEGSHLSAEFPRAGQGLNDTSPVKLRGVSVGNVSKIKLTDGGRAKVTLRIDKGVRVPDSVTAAVEPESVFGPKFVNLIPGEHEGSGPYLADGAVITRTESAKDLSDLLGQAHEAVSAIDPGKLSVIINTLAEGLVGQGTRQKEIIANISKLIRTSRANPNSLTDLFADTNRFTETIRGVDANAINRDTNLLIPVLTAGGDRTGRIADELTELSATGAHALSKHGGNLGEGFRSSERAAALVYAQLGVSGDAVRSINRLIPVWRALTSTPAPGGRKHLLNIQAFVPLNPCELIIGLCPGPVPGGR